MTTNKKFFRISLSVLLIAASIVPILSNNSVYADQITVRSLTLQDGAGGDGGSMTSGVVNHEFNFTLPNVGDQSVGSIKFEYCTTASGSCTIPTGLITNGGSTTLGYESGATGFTLDKTVNGAPYITKTPASITADTVLTYRLTDITNPSTVDPTARTFFVRISSYASIDTTGIPIDSGTVAASTADQITLTGTMPESLIFCVGETIGKTNSIPDCGLATAGSVSFDQLFSPTDTATATSQMSASTNAASGYNITINGPTLESGGNSILPMDTQGIGIRGTSQFGMNLKLNTVATSTIAVGAEIDAVSNGTDLRAQPTANYGTVDNFKFTSGDAIANSAFGGAGPTNAQIYTVSYIVNVPGSQAAGTYSTTLTYICTATF